MYIAAVTGMELIKVDPELPVDHPPRDCKWSKTLTPKRDVSQCFTIFHMLDRSMFAMFPLSGRAIYPCFSSTWEGIRNQKESQSRWISFQFISGVLHCHQSNLPSQFRVDSWTPILKLGVYLVCPFFTLPYCTGSLRRTLQWRMTKTKTYRNCHKV